MSRVAFCALLATFVAFSATAMTPEIDIDGDGKASFTETKIMYPDVTDDVFAGIDLNADNFLDQEELLTAVGTKALSKKGDAL